MTHLDLHFLLLGSITTEQFIDALSSKEELQETVRQAAKKIYYDSFDWRLYLADIVCTVVQGARTQRFSLAVLQTGALLAEANIPLVPVFANEIADTNIQRILAPVLEMRALLPVLTQDLTCYEWNILDKRQKIVSRLRVEAFETQTVVRLLPLRGYAKALSKWSEALQKEFDLQAVSPQLYSDALRQQYERTGHYSYKLNYRIAASMRADVASKQILSQLADVIKNNEHGVIANIDSEFLHDFRVAIRKTRSALGQLKGIFPKSAVQEFRDYFSWLGQLTGPCRDLDVYLLNFADYKNSLSAAMRDDLNPLYDFLIDKHRQVQRELSEHLQSPRYKKGLVDWERFLRQTTSENDAGETPSGAMPIKDFAAHRIWRVYRRVLREGCAIDENSPPEDLHELRKTCKKLRYLMEFFQNLFPTETIALLIRTLKTFQEVLGNFQDYQVQEEHLKHFGEEMRSAGVSVATFLAMGVLIQHLDDLRCEARADFAERFADFQNAEHREAFAALFAPQPYHSRALQ